MVSHLQFFGASASPTALSEKAAPDTDTIAGETTSNNDDPSNSSTNIDAVSYTHLTLPTKRIV